MLYVGYWNPIRDDSIRYLRLEEKLGKMTRIKIHIIAIENDTCRTQHIYGHTIAPHTTLKLEKKKSEGFEK